jgi:hypothetical protein
MSALAATAHPDDFPPAQKISVSCTFEAAGWKQNSRERLIESVLGGNGSEAGDEQAAAKSEG